VLPESGGIRNVQNFGIVAHRAPIPVRRTRALYVYWRSADVEARNSEVDRDALCEQIGRRKMELEWLKKKAGMLE
jgi:hypothetical protein